MKHEMTLQKRILERIKTQNVRPTPRGIFRAKDFVLWGLLGMFIAALSVGFGMILLMVRGADFTLLDRLGLSTSEKLVYSIPFFWIIATLVLAAVAFVNYRRTRSGYRTTGKQFAVATGVVAVTLGSVAYALDIPRFLDKTAAENIPLYNAVVPLNTNVWLDPEHGLLSGTVRERESDEEFTLRDANSVLWTVVGEDISMPKDFEFHAGDRVKIIGTQIGEDLFRAVEIMPR